jgi:hypothetical protein
MKCVDNASPYAFAAGGQCIESAFEITLRREMKISRRFGKHYSCLKMTATEI